MTVQHWRYSFPSENGEGWAIIFLDSAGCFAALSDWGNWTYRWNSRGINEPDFRQFFLTASDEYLLEKLNPVQEYDPEDTLKAVKQAYLEAFRSTSWRKRKRFERASAWMELNEMYNDLYTDSDFDQWLTCNPMDFDEPWYLRCDRHSQQAEQFIKRVMPRLREAIRKDLNHG